MKLTVDRIEENVAVCQTQDGEIMEIEIAKFITLPKDGDIVEETEDGRYKVLTEETQKEKDEISERFLNLFKK